MTLNDSSSGSCENSISGNGTTGHEPVVETDSKLEPLPLTLIEPVPVCPTRPSTKAGTFSKQGFAQSAWNEYDTQPLQVFFLIGEETFSCVQDWAVPCSSTIRVADVLLALSFLASL